MPEQSRVKPQPLQPEELKAIEARCEAATPGPWESHSWDAMEKPHAVAPPTTTERWECRGTHDVPKTGADADFIAHARTDIPRLIATIEEARSPKKTRKFSELRAKMSPEAQAASEVLAAEILSEEARREQPVRVTDAMLNAGVRAFVIYWRVTEARADVLLNAMQAAIAAALAAAPKEGGE